MKNLLLFLLLAASFAACSKGQTAKEATCKEGFIIWGQPLAADGIEWYFAESLEPGAKPYKFDNLPAEFQQDGLPVSICFYETNDTYACFCAVPLQVYHITSIQKKSQ